MAGLIYTKVSEILAYATKYLWKIFIILTLRAKRVRLKRSSLMAACGKTSEKARGFMEGIYKKGLAIR